MSKAAQQCARVSGGKPGACHYVWCQKNKACAARPENAKRILSTLHQPKREPSNGQQAQQQSGRKARRK